MCVCCWLQACSHILQFRQDIVIFMGQFVPRVYGQCGFTLPINLQDDANEEKITSKQKSMSSSLHKKHSVYVRPLKWFTRYGIRWLEFFKKCFISRFQEFLTHHYLQISKYRNLEKYQEYLYCLIILNHEISCLEKSWEVSESKYLVSVAL